VSWLEAFLHNYRGLVIAITHDRYFLDNVAGWILEIDAGGFYPFRGNYVGWLEAKSKRLLTEKKRNETLEKSIGRELEWVRQNAGAQRSKSKARMKTFEKMKEEREIRKANQRSEGGSLIIPEGPAFNGAAVQVRGVTVTMQMESGEMRTLIKNLSFELQQGDIMGVVGPNGSGKTTLLKVITGQRAPQSGSVQVNQSVVFGYNAQTRDKLSGTESVWEEIAQKRESIRINATHSMVSREYVAQFNFRGTDQQKKIAQLSGGERNRVHLAKSLAHGCNVLLLDEPTNDLDVDTLRALENALQNWGGAAIVVSHDRWFLDRICNNLLVFGKDGEVDWWPGNFLEYEAVRLESGEQDDSSKKGNDTQLIKRQMEIFKF
jgi:ATPase subunit of ABC transporter with duplicated ATPase domains